jgi:NADH pyrophosphatase NudC (nudix superfamily)
MLEDDVEWIEALFVTNRSRHVERTFEAWHRIKTALAEAQKPSPNNAMPKCHLCDSYKRMYKSHGFCGNCGRRFSTSA